MSIFAAMKRTKHNPPFTLFIYRSGKRYVGVCLELDLVDNGTDPEELEERMKKSIESYVRHVCKDDRFDERHLNRPAPKKYWDIFYKYVGDLQRTRETKKGASSDFFLSRQHLRSVTSV